MTISFMDDLIPFVYVCVCAHVCACASTCYKDSGIQITNDNILLTSVFVLYYNIRYLVVSGHVYVNDSHPYKYSRIYKYCYTNLYS